jgi:IS5 family transposase
MAQRRIGQEAFHFGAKALRQTSLDELATLIDWSHAGQALAGLYVSAKGEKAWPPLAMFKALLLATWYDLSDVRLAEASPLLERFSREAKRENRETGEALFDRAERIPQAEFSEASFRRFCGFAREEETPERTADVALPPRACRPRPRSQPV